MTTTAHSTEDLSQTTYQGVVQGPLFALPAGEVKVALLADHRRNTYEYQPDSQLAAQNIEAVIASQADARRDLGRRVRRADRRAACSPTCR